MEGNNSFDRKIGFALSCIVANEEEEVNIPDTNICISKIGNKKIPVIRKINPLFLKSLIYKASLFLHGESADPVDVYSIQLKTFIRISNITNN